MVEEDSLGLALQLLSLPRALTFILPPSPWNVQIASAVTVILLMQSGAFGNVDVHHSDGLGGFKTHWMSLDISRDIPAVLKSFLTACYDTRLC